MKTTILVTGVNGFVGHHVARVLHAQGYAVVGVSNQPTLEADLADIVSEYISCDLTDPEKVAQINLTDTSAIINLAGFAKVGDSVGQGALYDKVNIGVHAVLYQECINQGVSPRIVAVSSGSVYDPNQQLPITEESALVADDKAIEYTLSKKKAETAILAFNDKGLDCIVVRPFNHSGPGQLPGFLLPDLGQQIQTAAANDTPLMVGNLDTKRDYTDVRDVARAYVLLATCDRPNLKHTIYNICSGASTSGKDILHMLTAAFDEPDIATELDPQRIRPNEIMDIYGSRDRITADTGWHPEIPLNQMIMDYAAWKKQQ